MAVSKIEKINLIAPKEHQNDVLEILQNAGFIQIEDAHLDFDAKRAETLAKASKKSMAETLAKASEKSIQTRFSGGNEKKSIDLNEKISDLDYKLANIKFSLEFLEKYSEEKKNILEKILS